MCFELTPWRETGTHLLKGAGMEEVQMMLDDHLVKTQAMQMTPAGLVFEKDLVAWLTLLTEVASVVDHWLRVQGRWLYLEPIFGSADIMHQMPREGAVFKEVDTSFRAIMKRTLKHPEVNSSDAVF
jgi:dynein heavy chain